jgi:transcriptional regulator with XRE-family HTH domain
MNNKSFEALMKEAEESAELAIEEAKVDFALELSKVMERAGLSRSDMAARLGVSLPMITKILRGDSNLTIESMVKATRAAAATLHIHIIPQAWEGRWFETCPKVTASRTMPCRYSTEGTTSWPQERFDATQPIAA